MRRITLVLCLAAFVVCSVAAFAQTDTARLVGTITDQSGAAIPNATVTVTNVGTARAVTAKTDGAGGYVVNGLPIGKYHVEVKQSGFKGASADVTLQVSQVQEISLKLQPGNVETVVNVTDEIPLVETTTSNTGEVIQGRQITELPLNGRNFTQLALLTPGVTRGQYADQASGGGTSNFTETSRYADTGGASLSVNGLRPQANNFILDGVDDNEGLVNTIVFFPPAEAVQEFRISTSIAQAEFGRAGGAVVQTSIKSGTNSIHGSAFDFLRNNYFDAIPWGGTESPLHKNQFGGTLGGPMWKNKLFFFVDYQGLRQKNPDTPDVITVPTAAMKGNGTLHPGYADFTGLLGDTAVRVPSASICPNAAGNPLFVNQGYIFNPQTCLPWGWVGDATTGSPGANINLIPLSQVNPVGLKYLQAFPDPNYGAAGLARNNYRVQRAQQRAYDDYDARLDWVAGEKDTVFARFSYGQDNYTESSRLPLPAGPGSGDNPTHPRGVAVGYTHTFGPEVINEFRFGYTRPFYAYLQPGNGTPIANNLGIPVPNTPPLLGGIALIGGNGGTNEEIEYTGDFGAYSVPQKSIQFLDALSWNHGNHALKFGFNVIDRHVDFFQGNRGKGYFQLGGQDYVQGQYTGYEVSEILAGFVDYQIGLSNGYYRTRNWETGYFVQDDWRVSRKLTLNLGLRYDLFTWPYEVNDRQSNFDLATQQLIEPGSAGWPRALINTDKNNFAPRVGFAYDLFGNGKTVVRGGYGMFYFLDRGGVGVQLSNNAEFNGYTQYSARNGYRITLSGANPQVTGCTPNTTCYQGNLDWTTATGPLPVANLNINLTDPAGASVIAYPRNSQNSDVQQWNLQVERQLGGNMSASVAYVGTKMDHLATNFAANQKQLGTGTVAYPIVNSVNEYAFVGNGTYNGLQTSLNRRFSNGLQFTAAYTWSHTLDDSEGAFSQNGNGNSIPVGANGLPLLALNKGNSSSDIRHFATFSSLYELPFGKGKEFGSNMPTALDYVLGGWQWNNVITIAGGTPIDYTIGSNDNYVNVRPDLGSYKIINKEGPCVGNTSNTCYIIATASLTAPAGNGHWTSEGTLPHNFFRGPGFHSWDMGVFKNFKVTERVTTTFRAEAFNLTNTPQFTYQNNSTTAQVNGVNGSVPFDGSKPADVTFQTQKTQLNTQRQMQFALEVRF